MSLLLLLNTPATREGYAAQGVWALGIAPQNGGDAPEGLFPTLYTNNQTFFGPTVTRGAVNLQPARFDNAQTFFGPVVTQAGGPQTITPALFTNNQVFYGATITQGAGGTQTLSPSLFTNANQFFGGQVGDGFQDTHDGFFAREYRKMWEYKKPTKAEIVEALEEDATEVIEALPEVKQEIRREYGRVDYSKVAQNAQMLAFVAKQIQIALELRRIELDEEDAEILLLM